MPRPYADKVAMDRVRLHVGWSDALASPYASRFRKPCARFSSMDESEPPGGSTVPSVARNSKKSNVQLPLVLIVLAIVGILAQNRHFFSTGGAQQAAAIETGNYARLREHSQIQAVIVDIVRMQLGIEERDIVQAPLLGKEGLGADDLDHVEIIMAVEEAFDVGIPDERAVQIRTIAQMVEAVMEAQAKRSDPDRSP